MCVSENSAQLVFIRIKGRLAVRTHSLAVIPAPAQRWSIRMNNNNLVLVYDVRVCVCKSALAGGGGGGVARVNKITI